MLDYCTSDTIFMRPLCLQPAAVQICPSILNGALLLEHNVAYYLERCSESVGSIHMDHCYCNVPLVDWRHRCGQGKQWVYLQPPRAEKIFLGIIRRENV